MKQKTCRLSDPELFQECADLLRRQLGSNLPDSQVIVAALTALRVQHTEYLITVEEATETAKRSYLPSICKAITQTIELLDAARLIQAGDYVVEGDPASLKLKIIKDGVEVEPLEEQPEPETPSWAKDVAAKLRTVN